MFRDAINYPRRGEDLGRKYLIGTLLTLGSILILPAFILLGYFTKAMNQTLQGDEQLPKFEDYTGLFIDGVKLTGFMLAYFLIPVALISAFDAAGKATGTESILISVSVILLFLALYILPAALVNFARDKEMMDAFRVKEITEKAFTSKYFLGLLTIIGTSILIGLVQIAALIVLMVTIIGIPAIIAVLPAMRFYENLVYFRMMAEIAE